MKSSQHSSSTIPHIHIDQYPKLVKEGVFIFDDEVWSTQKRIARIYGRSIPTINDHLKKIYREKELMKTLSERVLMITQQEGKKKVARKVYVYNSDVMIAIGFRVKGEWGKEFRIWAREVVRSSYDPKDQIKHLTGRNN
ncbi:MAG: RhuM family protein [Candidatus Paceibacterota bacterium]|jgi:hypothetical protein